MIKKLKVKETKYPIGELINGKKENYINLDGFDGTISLDELFQIKLLINDRLGDFIIGSSYQGNGVNFNITLFGKPYFLRIEKNEILTKIWKERKLGVWENEEPQTTTKNQIEGQ